MRDTSGTIDECVAEYGLYVEINKNGHIGTKTNDGLEEEEYLLRRTVLYTIRWAKERLRLRSQSRIVGMKGKCVYGIDLVGMTWKVRCSVFDRPSRASLTTLFVRAM